MIKTRLFLMMFLTALLCISCDPNDDNNPNANPNGNDNFSEHFGASASRDFIGQVVDVNGHAVQNATVKIGTSTTQTDSNGIFILNEADVNERFAYITATKIGYVDGSRALVPTSGTNNIRIMLLPLEVTQTIASGANSEVLLPNGTKVKFDGAFKDENGNSYSGDVNVSMFHLSPSNDNLSAIMPGMLYAEDAAGQEKALETYGMMNVELRGSGGQKLQLADGHTAEITVAIDAAQMATAPATIPLWHFDSEKGYWKEDGFATKTGNKYVGTVSHFSWWNCDAQFPTVTLTCTVVDNSGNPLPGIPVSITRIGGYSTYGYTDSNGVVSGLVPANETLTLAISTNSACNNIIAYTDTIGPFSSSTTLPNIVVNNPQLESVLVQGNLVKCDNTNVTNGYVLFRNNANYNSGFAAVTNGAFSFHELSCNTDSGFVLTGADYDSLQTTDSLSFAYTNPVTDVGNIAACNAVTEFISYQIDSNPVVFIIGIVNGYVGFDGGPYTSVSGYNQNQSGLYISGNTDVSGIYTTNQFSIEGGAVGYISSGTTNTIIFNVTIAPVGGFIDIAFSGTYNDNNGLPHTISGTAHALRE
ncbi:MAG TPA: hypothetical protein VK528_11125 [Flavobacterium sp.]|nr:hypothetical protein [Flavobacterium sp.]